MPSGGCFCGNVRISYQGEPKRKVRARPFYTTSFVSSKKANIRATQALCHCVDCRKISGSTYSTNILVAENDFTVSGSPKQISTTGENGNMITSYFCGDCGSTLWREGVGFPGLKIIKAGVMDDLYGLDNAKPEIEYYSERRVAWVPQIPGSDGMLKMGA
ncbi:uncharacterized protein PV09_08806 [Verruconis gallopava]|uniref:CENP-V/GFA domain-containing protein n=1 Tax=Verruconis gallopava TaxID=253628 RepID=A0A0D1YFJ4_9PEZI|nr:uncharacterized protein PV09_08806 [Verruconis gallopava]KIV99501.1 hypothetical protein PV09_08806 [Verruconis gallopava]